MTYEYDTMETSLDPRIALGWHGLIERLLQDAVLAPLLTDYVNFDRGIYAILITRGRGHPLAQQFMDCLSNP